MCCCFEGCYSTIFALIVLVNVGCGLCVSGTVAFFDDGVNIGAVLAFGLYALFSAGIIYLIVKEVYFNEDTSSSLNWICGMSAVVTIGAIVAIYVLGKPARRNEPIIIGAIVVASANLIVTYCVACCYVNILRLGLDGRRRARDSRPQDVVQSFPDRSSKGQGSNEVTMEQSLARIVNHVQHNPTNKTYKMYAVGSETPFEVAM